MSLSEYVCYCISTSLISKRKPGEAGHHTATFSTLEYQEWRTRELSKQFFNNFDIASLAGKDVLDLGCGEGDLLFLLAQSDARSLTGIDLKPERISIARSRPASIQMKVAPTFLLGMRENAIDIDDNSIDLILCFDVLEHIMDFKDVIKDWKRVLRPEGKVYIWWVPWLHPYGHHIESLIPIPWAHILFSDKTLLNTCAKIYDSACFTPRIWDLDENGNKKSNKWKDMDHLPEVNKLTMNQFEKFLQQTGFRIEKKRMKSFGGSRISKMTGVFLSVPILRELFCSSVTYVLSCPSSTS